ncbi:MAG: hypothetical protein DYG93_09575 [Leptolyngbya sp. PLA2]|nr:hypothetical protein [Leptolyngbya sp.]MCE7971894.1 hypothetical protein [Leptolyngbya sp. PL-A2]MCQ3939743.1 hypothetical protein [cyanobacterium CYA1]MCZ7632008.1 hypothetical protein [Phycisphaerales bacterium]MDL1903999.1 hypothetical protein [Synechococcales cyanobacterium CNB]GIK18763.1 MAG: hypothetical protein BroJett004_09270 [Planctomycetota bacterium]
MRQRVIACATAAVASIGSVATATPIEVEAFIASGLYSTGDHSPGHLNYYIGHAPISSPPERRNYFVFDLGSVGAPIVSAKLKLYMPGDELKSEPCGYSSVDPTEMYKLSGSPFPWTMFVAAFETPDAPKDGIKAMFGTLGEGVPYGFAMLSGEDCGKDVVIDLTAEGVAALNAAFSDPHGPKIVLGGRLTDITPGEPDIFELAFAYSDIPPMPYPRLELTLVPAPGTVGVLLGACMVGSARRRR